MALEELCRHVDELCGETSLRASVDQDGAQVFVVLHDVCLPPGAYRVAVSDVLFITDAQYPLSAMDMFWTDLTVVLPDGSISAGADVLETYLGRQWRRFSWHRNGIWNPNGNPLLDHFEFMQARFAQDAPK